VGDLGRWEPLLSVCLGTVLEGAKTAISHRLAVFIDSTLIIMKSITLSFAGLFFSIASMAQPGSLDPSFGTHGKVITSNPSGGAAVAIQDDQTIVAAGSATGGNSFTAI